MAAGQDLGRETSRRVGLVFCWARCWVTVEGVGTEQGCSELAWHCLLYILLQPVQGQK